MADGARSQENFGTQAPTHFANANDQIGDGNKNIGAATSQAGRSLALT